MALWLGGTDKVLWLLAGPGPLWCQEFVGHMKRGRKRMIFLWGIWSAGDLSKSWISLYGFIHIRVPTGKVANSRPFFFSNHKVCFRGEHGARAASAKTTPRFKKKNEEPYLPDFGGQMAIFSSKYFLFSP